MTTAGRSYFRYRLRSQWKMLLCIVLIALVLTVWSASSQKWFSTYIKDGNMQSRVFYDCTLYTSMAVLFVCSFLLPVTEFSVFKKRTNLDCLYGLPISRRQMGMVHYLTGLIFLVVSYSFAYLANFLLLLRYPEGFYYPPLLSYYFLSLGLGICAYSFNVFVFNRANSTGDGIWFMLLCGFAVFVIIETYNEISLHLCYAFSPDAQGVTEMWKEKWEIPNSDMANYQGALIYVNSFYSWVVEKNGNAFSSAAEVWGEWSTIVYLLYLAAAGIASALGFVFTFGKGRAEKTGEVSDSWFGFKTMIPIYTVWFYICGMMGILGIIVGFVGYLIYRKGFHLKRSDWITLAVLGLLNLLWW